MDVLSTLPVRFHFNGEFVRTRKKLFYCGGREAMSYIDRDHVSLPEMFGQLKDHCLVQEGTLLHWRFPGKELDDGLRVLVDDKSCLDMADCIVEGGVAEIYVEEPSVIDIVETESRNIVEKQIKFVREWYNPTKVGQSSSQPSKVCEAAQCSQPSKVVDLAVADHDCLGGDEEMDDSSDSDYLAGDDCSSEEDEETTDILNKFREFKRKIKAGEPANLDAVILEVPKGESVPYEVEDEDSATSYEDSDGEEDSVEELSDGEVAMKKSKYPRL
ncbi:unnamed protein product [Urochloa humidicola]